MFQRAVVGKVETVDEGPRPAERYIKAGPVKRHDGIVVFKVIYQALNDLTVTYRGVQNFLPGDGPAENLIGRVVEYTIGEHHAEVGPQVGRFNIKEAQTGFLRVLMQKT